MTIKVWTKIHPYLGGMDCFIPTEGKSSRYKINAKSIEMSVEEHLQKMGNRERPPLPSATFLHKEEE